MVCKDFGKQVHTHTIIQVINGGVNSAAIYAQLFVQDLKVYTNYKGRSEGSEKGIFGATGGWVQRGDFST